MRNEFNEGIELFYKFYIYCIACMRWIFNYINGASYSSDGVMNEFYNKCVVFSFVLENKAGI